MAHEEGPQKPLAVKGHRGSCEDHPKGLGLPLPYVLNFVNSLNLRFPIYKMGIIKYGQNT